MNAGRFNLKFGVWTKGAILAIIADVLEDVADDFDREANGRARPGLRLTPAQVSTDALYARAAEYRALIANEGGE